MDTGPSRLLPPDALRTACDPKSLDFATTAELDPISDVVGQARAMGAIELGARIKGDGFNIFALGPTRSGRHTAVRALLEAKAAAEPVPDDWVYVNNFAAADKPKAMRLPKGVGPQLKDGMRELIEDLSAAIPAIFEAEEYRNRRKAIDDAFEDLQEQLFEALRKKTEAESIAIVRTPMGFALAPVSHGQVIKPEDFNDLPEAERAAIGKKIEALQEELAGVLRNMPRLEKERRGKIRSLNAELAEVVVGQAIEEIAARFAGQGDIAAYLTAVHGDLIGNVEVFLKPQQDENERSFGMPAAFNQQHPFLTRYSVNVLVSHGEARTSAPVETEEHPTLANLQGRIDHRSLMGALVTDFTMIKAGALHRANGGYLILDARRVLLQPFAWEALKRCIRNRKIEMTGMADEFSLVTTVSLAPDPIPLDVKIVLVGERLLYYLLASLDPDFADLFKIEADFEDEIERTPESSKLMARLLATIARREALLPLDAGAVAGVIDEAAREAEDAERLTLRVGILADLLREAQYWAREAKQDCISAADVERALKERRIRGERLRDHALEQIKRGTLLIATSASAIGQINGLSVLSIGNLVFGKPSRITARVRMGSGKVVDIEREVELGGPIHSKGVLILSSFIATRYALDVPMSLWASLVFEQSYGGVEGDSASSAELYALLSALAEVPIRQGFAVTGSVNQFGEVQAIGGVNHKIEGFFDVCAAGGLSGDQGVLIPAANRKHLMLRADVVAAARAGRFHIHAVSYIDEGIAILTGLEAGSRGGDGHYPAGSINAKVEARLIAFAEARRAFGKSVE